MHRVALGEYQDLYDSCSRLDDARLLGIRLDTSDSEFCLELSFDISTNPSNSKSRFVIVCKGLEGFSFAGDNFNQFMLMSGYPDSLYIRGEEWLHTLYFLPNAQYPQEGAMVEDYELRLSCKELYWLSE